MACSPGARGRRRGVHAGADYIADVASYPELARLIDDVSRPDGRNGVAQHAIDGPSHTAGLRLEAGLVDLLVYDVLGRAGRAAVALAHARGDVAPADGDGSAPG